MAILRQDELEAEFPPLAKDPEDYEDTVTVMVGLSSKTTAEQIEQILAHPAVAPEQRLHRVRLRLRGAQPLKILPAQRQAFRFFCEHRNASVNSPVKQSPSQPVAASFKVAA